MHIVIRQYQPSDREAVITIFRDGIQEHINPAFIHAMTQPIHIILTLLFYIGSYVLGQSVLFSLVVGGAWVGLIYFCCYEIFSSYVRARLRTDMKDIPGYFLSSPDNCFWVAEAEMDGKSQILGMVAVEAKKDPGIDGKKYGELFRMIVSSTCRRTGLGLKLAKTVTEFCKERGFSKIVLSTTSTQRAAVALYNKLGFKTVLVHTKLYSLQWLFWISHSTILNMEKVI